MKCTFDGCPNEAVGWSAYCADHKREGGIVVRDSICAEIAYVTDDSDMDIDFDSSDDADLSTEGDEE